MPTAGLDTSPSRRLPSAGARRRDVRTPRTRGKMPLFVIQVKCPLCDGEHPTGIVLKLDDGPLAKETVATFCADRKVPPDLALRGKKFVCSATGDSFSPESDEAVLIVPQAYRF